VIRFARTGDPGWQAYDPATRATMIFDQVCAVAYDPRPQQRMTWKAIR
jgi:carboxylesterase type B